MTTNCIKFESADIDDRRATATITDSRLTALIDQQWLAVDFDGQRVASGVHGRAAAQQRMRLGRSAVIGQRTEQDVTRNEKIRQCAVQTTGRVASFRRTNQIV